MWRTHIPGSTTNPTGETARTIFYTTHAGLYTARAKATGATTKTIRATYATTTASGT